MSLARRPVAIVAVAVGVLGTLVMAALAAVADENAVGGSAALTLRDVGVGLCFGLAALAATGPVRQRVVIAAVGPAWLAGSLFQSALSLHQAVLAVALLAAPSGGLRRRVRPILATVGSVLVVGEYLSQLEIAGYFLVVAALVWAAAERVEPATAVASGAGLVVALVLAFGWYAVPRGTSTATVLAIYEGALVCVALGLSAATWLDARARTALADRVLSGRQLVGLDGLRQVLAGVLHDEQLEIEPATEAGIAADRGHAQTNPWRGVLQVYDGDALVATVSTGSTALADGPTAEAVATAVRLTTANLRLNEERARQVAEVEASRARLLAAVDRERERVVSQLRSQAGAHLDLALAELDAVHTDRSSGPTGLSRLVEDEIAAAAAAIDRIVAGAPPAALGSGRLGPAISALAGRSPVPVSLDLADDAAADALVETALFYVCSESLTNIARHSGATRATIELRRAPDGLVMVIHDNGRGGANAEGSGLRGLRDRLATLGGKLLVEDAAEGGTILTAAVPT